MKLLFSVTYYSPYISGLTLCVQRLAENLTLKKYPVTVLCMRHDPRLPLAEKIAGVQVVRARPLLRVSKGYLSLDWVIQAWRQIKNHDIVVINLPQFEGFIPALFAKISGKKVVALYHCEIVYPRKLIQKLVEFSNLTTLILADSAVTYTKDYAESSRLLKPFGRKLTYIYPPVVLTKTFKKPPVRKLPGDIWIGVAARLAREKGFENILAALDLINLPVKLVVAGPIEPVGEEKYRRQIMSLIGKNKGKIIFLGALDPAGMTGFYKSIDVLVLPSVNSTESFGMVQVEAMFAGVPVVASDLPGVRVPIRLTGMGVLVPPGNPSGLARAVIQVVRNRPDYARGRSLARKTFPLAGSLDLYEKLFAGLSA